MRWLFKELVRYGLSIFFVMCLTSPAWAGGGPRQWVGGNSMFWSDPTNWMPMDVPDSNVEMAIINLATVTPINIILDINVSIFSLDISNTSSLTTLIVDGQTLDLDDLSPSLIGFGGVLALGPSPASEITGIADINVTDGSFLFSGGTLSGPGMMTVAGTGLISFTGPDAKNINNRSILVNTGMDWDGSDINVMDSLITIGPTGFFTITSMTSMIGMGASQLIMDGTLARNNLAGSTQFQIPVNSTGNITSESGEMVFNAPSIFNGVTFDTLLGGTNSSLRFQADASFQNCTFQGIGSHRLDGGIFTFTGADSQITAGTTLVGEMGATFTGTVTLDNFGTATLLTSQLAGNFQLFNRSGAQLNLNQVGINGNSNITNDTGGMTDWQMGNLTLDSNAVFANLAVFNIFSTGQILSDGLGAAIIINTGTMIKTSPGNTNVNVPFQNDGLVNANNGFLRFLVGMTNNNQINVNMPGGIELIAGTHTQAGSGAIAGNGVVKFLGGIANINGLFNVSGFTQVNGGIANFTTGLAVNMNQLDLLGGEIQGTSNITVTMVMNWMQGVLRGTGILNIAPLATLQMTSPGQKALRDGRSLALDGPVNWNAGDLIMGEGSILDIRNNFMIENDLQLMAGPGVASQILNSGVVHKVMGPGTAVIGVALQNTGDLRVSSGELAFGLPVIQNGGRTELVSANFDFVQGLNLNNGDLEGSGKVSGNVTLNGGSLKPGLMGNGVGVLNFSNDLTLGALATTVFQIQSGGAPGISDQIIVAGTAVLGGSAGVLLEPLYNPMLGDTFPLLIAGTLNGSFATINLPPSADGLSAQSSIIGNSFQVQIQINPPPMNPQFFIANNTSLDVGLGDPNTGVLNTTITGFTGPMALSSSQNGGLLLIADLGAGSVTLVNTFTNQRLFNMPGFVDPVDATFNANGSQAWILNANVGSSLAKQGITIGYIDIMDTGNGQIIGTINNPCLMDVISIVRHPISGSYYVLAGIGSICVFDSGGNFQTSVALPTLAPSGMEIAPGGENIFVTSQLDMALYRVDSVNFNVAALALSNPPREMDFDGSGQQLFIAAAPDQILQVDTASMAQVGGIPVVGAMDLFGLSALPSENIGFVSDPVTGQVWSFTLDNLNLVLVATGIGEPVTIGDNDLIVQDPGGLRFTQVSHLVDEGAAQALIQIERVGGTFGELNGLVTSFDDTAQQGLDYLPVNQAIFFANGEAGTKDVLVPIIDDTLVEADERLTLTLTAPDGVTPILVPNVAELIILENEAGVFQLDNASYFVNESSGELTVGVQRVGALLGEVMVVVTTHPISATPNFDYQNIATQVTFLNGAGGIKLVSIPIFDDAIAEQTESFRVALQFANGNGVLGVPAQAEVMILDDDPVQIMWSEMAHQVSEAEPGKRVVSVSVQVQSSRIADFPIFFNYQIGGTATPGLDHDLNQNLGIIPIGRRSALIQFQVLPDDLFEEDETVVLSFVNTTSAIGEPATWTLTILDDERRQPVPNVTILSPAIDSQWRETDAIPFIAEVMIEAEVSLAWEICKTTGQCIQRNGNGFNLNLDAGRYLAICVATNLATGDMSLAEKTVFQVVINEPEATLRVVFPDRRRQRLSVGDTQTFRAEVAHQGDGPVMVEWVLAGTDQILGTGLQLQRTFSEEGSFTLVARVRATRSPGARDWREIVVSPLNQRQAEVQILSPSDRRKLFVGETLQFQGRVIDPDGDGRTIPLSWNFGDGRTANGAIVNNISFDQAGRFQIRLFGQLDNQRLTDEISIFVQDPELGPLVGIFPVTDQQINPFDPMIPNSGQVFFRPLIHNSRGFGDLNYFWDFGNGQTSRADVPGLIRFENEGSFVVTLVVRTGSGLVSPIARRTVVVKRTNASSFEPNNDFAQAATLSAGQFPNLLVDDSGTDFYQIAIERAGQNLVIRLFQNENAVVKLFNQNRDLLRTETLGNSGRIQLVGLNPGTYFLQVTAPPESKRLDISYGLSIEVLNPSLYFPDVESSPMMATELGMVNLSGSNASLEALAFDSAGNLLVRTPLTLKGNGRVHLNLEDLFPDDYRHVKWVEVDATADLVGYSRTLSRDGQELYAMTASKKRSASMFVPHIAENVAQWFTRATVVNVDQAAGNAVIETPGTQVPLVLDQGFAQDRFEFVERFGGSLPEDGIWARLRETSSRVNLVGVEVFGTKDGTRQVAGLELLDNQRDNPNFVYVANNLYFTHIASDVSTFYTGIALVNVGQLPQTIRIFAYGVDGTRSAPKTMTLGPNEKIVSLADQFLDGIGSLEQTAWVLVEADSDISGFEVFGTRDAKRLAGLEAANALRSELCYPYIDDSGRTFHGVSLINPHLVNNLMSLTLYDDQGQVLATREMTLAPGQKLVTLMADLFPESFNGQANAGLPGWLGLKATLPTAGFELFTSKDNARMGAILAQ